MFGIGDMAAIAQQSLQDMQRDRQQALRDQQLLQNRQLLGSAAMQGAMRNIAMPVIAGERFQAIAREVAECKAVGDAEGSPFDYIVLARSDLDELRRWLRTGSPDSYRASFEAGYPMFCGLPVVLVYSDADMERWERGERPLVIVPPWPPEPKP